jgi:hypothetical protein
MNPLPLAASAAALAGLIGVGNPAIAAAAPQHNGGGSTSSTIGYDISYPQCPSSTPRGAAFGIVGATDGKPWSSNPCLNAQWTWAAGRPGAPALYTNTANPGPTSVHWNLGGPDACADPTSTSDTGCAYDYGWDAAQEAYGVATGALPTGAAASHTWWLDVETGNSWNGTTAANAADIQGYVDDLHKQGVATVGVYSTGYQWGVITGGAALASTVSDWVAGASSQRQAASMCSSSYSFSGGHVTLTQFPSGGFDGDYPCA